MTKNVVIGVERLGFALPVHHHRPQPAGQGEDAHRGRDDPLDPAGLGQARVTPSGHAQGDHAPATEAAIMARVTRGIFVVVAAGWSLPC